MTGLPAGLVAASSAKSSWAASSARAASNTLCPPRNYYRAPDHFDTRPPCFHKLLSETVTTFAVFLPWMYLLDGDDNYILSVPFSTRDTTLTVGRVVKIARWWLPVLSCLGYASWFSSKRGCSPCLSVLLSFPRVTCSTIPVFSSLPLRPSALVCCCHWVSWERGRLAVAQEAVRFSSFLLDWFCM